MNTIKLYLRDYSILIVDAPASIKQEISDHFTFYVPNYKYHPLYKKKVWDGKIRLFNQDRGELTAGLYNNLRYFCAQRRYPIALEESRFGYAGQVQPLDMEMFNTFLQSINLPFIPRDYQYKAVVQAIKDTRRILLSPTGSGKSFVIYLIARWYLWSNFERQGIEFPTTQEKILVIVPTTSLVEQMYSDFKSYGLDVDQYVHKVYSGQDKESDKPIIISTWQSIYKFPGTWFEKFKVIFGDECHGFKAKSLSSIMNKSRFAQYRYGLTGTLDGSETNELTLEGLFGPVYKVTTTKKLQDEDTLAPLKITILKLRYNEQECSQVMRKRVGSDKKKAYHEELDFLVSHAPRNNLISNLAIDQKGNTLVMFQFVEKHGKVLYELIRDKVDKGRKVFFVHGGTETEDREAIRKIIESQKDAIVVASLGTFSTGINIRNLHNIIFAQPSKSQIKVLQSIGRGLRKSDNGQTTKLIDIADDLSWEGKPNFTLTHSANRIQMYTKEQFDFKLVSLDIS